VVPAARVRRGGSPAAAARVVAVQPVEQVAAARVQLRAPVVQLRAARPLRLVQVLAPQQERAVPERMALKRPRAARTLARRRPQVGRADLLVEARAATVVLRARAVARARRGMAALRLPTAARAAVERQDPRQRATARAQAVPAVLRARAQLLGPVERVARPAQARVRRRVVARRIPAVVAPRAEVRRTAVRQQTLPTAMRRAV
jgi:hypothetical protein